MKALKNVLLRMRYIRNWWTVIPPLNRLHNKEVILTLAHGEKIKVRDLFGRDFSSLMQMCEDFDSYLSYYSQLKNVKTIVDAGAFGGVFSIQLARLFPQATVYAIEPHPENFALLCENIRLNGFLNIKPIQAALSDTQGTVELNVDSDAASHSIAFKLRTNTGVVSVPAITLKEFSHIDVLKMDIEGAEYDVLADPPDAELLLLELHEREGHDKNKLRQSLSRRFELIDKPHGGFQQSAEMLICRRTNKA